jgi:hypothetical protein
MQLNQMSWATNKIDTQQKNHNCLLELQNNTLNIIKIIVFKTSSYLRQTTQFYSKTKTICKILSTSKDLTSI